MERTAKTYAAAIDSLNVESNYLPKGVLLIVTNLHKM